MKSELCACGNQRRPAGFNCRDCHNATMRRYRLLGTVKKDDPIKVNARGYLHVYVKRGKVKKLACQNCGAIKSEAHHPDYSKPLEVIWLCRKCHQKFHKEQSQGAYAKEI